MHRVPARTSRFVLLFPKENTLFSKVHLVPEVLQAHTVQKASQARPEHPVRLEAVDSQAIS